MTNIYLSAIIAGFIFFSCKTATKAYEEGNYTAAVELAVKKLQKDPQDASLQQVLKKSYQYAVNEREDKIRTLSASSSDGRWIDIYNEYKALQNLYETVQQYPAVSAILPAVDYSSYVQTYKEKAADTYYDRGMKWMADENKSAYRKAYYEFNTALRYKPNDFEIKKMRDDAFELAVVNVLVMPIDMYEGGYYYHNNAFLLRNFQNNVMRHLANNNMNDFVRFFTSPQFGDRYDNADEVLEMRLGRLHLGQPYDRVSTRRVSKDVVVKETVYKKDSVVKEYAKVYATIQTTRRTLVSVADLYVTSRAANGRILWSDRITGDYQWEVQFATYTGDERALSESDKADLNRNRNYYTPDQDEITAALFREMENKLLQRLRNYYQQYN